MNDLSEATGIPLGINTVIFSPELADSIFPLPNPPSRGTAG